MSIYPEINGWTRDVPIRGYTSLWLKDSRGSFSFAQGSRALRHVFCSGGNLTYSKSAYWARHYGGHQGQSPQEFGSGVANCTSICFFEDDLSRTSFCSIGRGDSEAYFERRRKLDTLI